ncbi:MAG: class D sortase [Patescibacteria group bacterium]
MKELQVDERDFKKLFIADTPTARAWRRAKKLIKQLVTLGVLYLLFFVVLNFGAYWQRFEYSVNAQPVEKEKIVVAPIIPEIQYKPELQIPKLGLTAPLLTDIDPAVMVEYLKQGVTQYLDTAKPGQVGNSVIVGHSSDFPWSDGLYKNVFALLDKLVAGDQIIIPYGSQRYIYEVYESTVVRPTELSVLRKTNEPILTLLTCYPVGSTRNRLIVRAKLISNNAGSPQLTEPFIGEGLPQPR